LPLSPITSAPIPLSTIPKRRLWTTRFSRWFLVFAFEVLRSVRIVCRMTDRKAEGTWGRRGRRVCNNLDVSARSFYIDIRHTR
jgi:hypothetical protein